MTGGRVLVVDDVEAQRYALARVLRHAGFEVVAVGTGRAALRETTRGDFDAVVLDVNLPDVGGYEVCRVIKSRPESSVPVIHVSATSGTLAARVQGLDNGADAYLVEPVDPRELIATVTAVMRAAATPRPGQAHAQRLQHALRPRRTPSVPGLEIAATYAAAGREALIGGDWYEVVPGADGRTRAVVGDVMGHGPAAAGAMAELRGAVRALLLDQHSPSGVLERADRFVTHGIPDALATLVVVELVHSTGVMTYARAGHPAPVVRDANGTRVLRGAAGPVLGTGGAYGEAVEVLDPGALVVLATDGVEGSSGAPDPATDFARRVAQGPAAPKRLAQSLVDGRRRGQREDDAAVLVLRYVGGADQRVRNPA